MDDCIFCRIVKGELPASKIHEDEHTLAFLNIVAAHPGHALVIVKEHVENLYGLSDAQSAAVFQATTRVARAVKAATGCDGVTLFQANEVAGGQTVFHFHIHVLPRFKEDNLLPFWKASAPGRAELDEMAARLREVL
ncbi:HIT family protein [Zoogloea sp.]|uniref:HIT family protein n=1 Tax=Zoogloea sp. TaxID=49181 RepID=UPI0026027497|nr:HIT family protein [Zoogloea sp.]MDD3353804.1 HIT family protein [Zoogloea sp.]